MAFFISAGTKLDATKEDIGFPDMCTIEEKRQSPIDNAREMFKDYEV